MRIERTILIERPPADVFALVSDPTAYDEFFVGMSRWEPRSRKHRGVGARFKVLMKVGSIEAGGILRVTGWKEPERIGWESESGVQHRGTWTMSPADAQTKGASPVAWSTTTR